MATLGAILVVLLAGGLVFAFSVGEALVAALGGAGPCANGPASTATHAPMPSDWARVSPPPEAAPETSIWGAAWVRDRWVAVGFDAAASDLPTPGVAWTSADGVTWSATASLGGDSSASAVTPVGSSAIVVGRYGNDAAAWYQADGAWGLALLPSRSGPFASEAFIVDGDCGRLVAAGPNGEDLVPVTWTSADALNWERVELPQADVSSSAFGVAVTQEVQVVVGAGTRSDGSIGAVAWRATDGNDWRALDLPGPGALAGDVAATADGFVAVGWSSEPATPVLWRSRDGLAWERMDVPTDLADAGLALELTAVEAWGSGFVVAGLGRSGDGTARGLVWVASDGETLRPVVAPGDAILFDEVAVGPRGMVLIGRFDGPDGMGSRGAIWVSR